MKQFIKTYTCGCIVKAYSIQQNQQNHKLGLYEFMHICDECKQYNSNELYNRVICNNINIHINNDNNNDNNNNNNDNNGWIQCNYDMFKDSADSFLQLVNQVIQSIDDHTFQYMLKTKEMCVIAVQYNYNTLGNFFWKYESQELDDIATYCNPHALFWINDKFKTPELCKRVLQKIPYMKKYIPKNYTLT